MQDFSNKRSVLGVQKKGQTRSFKNKHNAGVRMRARACGCGCGCGRLRACGCGCGRLRAFGRERTPGPGPRVQAWVRFGEGVVVGAGVCAHMRAWLWAQTLVRFGVGLGCGVCGRGRMCGREVPSFFVFFEFLVFVFSQN